MAITRDRQARTLSMSQELYVVDLITKFGSFLDASVTRTFRRRGGEARDT